MLQNKKHISFTPLWILGFLCFISSIVLLYSASVFFNYLEEDNFKIQSLIIKNQNETDNNFSIIPLERQALGKKAKIRNDFMKKLIVEYLINRYTVNNSKILMENNLGLESDIKDFNHGWLLKRPSILGFKADGSPDITNAYSHFINKSDGELQEIKDLMKNNITRTVEIIDMPQKKGDWWTTKVKFIYKTASIFNRKDAKTELYEIALHAVLKTVDKKLINKKQPSSIFAFLVYNIQKTKLQ